MRKSLPFFLFVFLVITAVFSLVEIKIPYYFLQDDNRTYFLPNFVHNYRAVFTDHQVPLYNFHQYLGIQHLSMMQPAVFYPLIYASLFLSTLLFNNFYGAIDIMVYVHLLIGAAGMFFLVRTFGYRREVAAFAALTWPLISFSIFLTSSWWFVSGTIAYFPWIAGLSIHLIRVKRDFVNILLLAGARSLLFFVGYVQFFIYALIFEAITLAVFLVIQKKEAGPKAYFMPTLQRYVLSQCFTFAIIVPVLLPAMYQMYISAFRSAPLGWHEYSSISFQPGIWLLGLFNPFLWPNEGISLDYKIPYLSYVGYVTIGWAFYSVVLLVRKMREKQMPDHFTALLFIFFLLFLIAFFWSSNPIAQLIVYGIPLLNHFRWPFKLEAFTAFYLLLFAATGLAIFFEKIKRQRAFFFVLIFFTAAQFFLLYGVSPSRSFLSFSSNRELYATPEPFLAERGRMITINDDDNRFFDEDNARTDLFAENYATLWNLYHFGGYDPLISSYTRDATLNIGHLTPYYSSQPEIPIDYLRRWGVSWYVIDGQTSKFGNALSSRGAILAHEKQNRLIFRDPLAKPLVFWSDDGSAAGITSEFKTNTIAIATNDAYDRSLNVNFLYNDFFRAYINGKKTTIFNDNGQLNIHVPAGNNNIIVQYDDPYFRFGLLLSFSLVVILTVYATYRFKQALRFGRHTLF